MIKSNALKGKNIAICLPDLSGGGAERLHLNLSSSFVVAGARVTLVVLREIGALVESIPAGVQVVSLESTRTLIAIFPLIRYLRSKQPDILVSNMGHINILCILARIIANVPTRIIASIHNTVSIDCSERNTLKYKILPLLYKIFLGKADGIVAVSKGVADDLAQTARISRDRITVIYNPVVQQNFTERMNARTCHCWLEDRSVPIILGVGRLVPQKDFPTLISAFSLITKNIKARLIILGDGPLIAELETLANSKYVSDSVSFPGFHENPLPFMRAAAVLVMSSRYEGFGNVLAEALACGTPVVSTDCPHGPAEILMNGKYGRLVPIGDVPAMAKAITETINNSPDDEFLRGRGQEFSVTKVANQYIQMLNNVCELN